MMTQESQTQKLGHHLLRPVDEATRQRARLHLLDWLACVAGALQSRPARNHFAKYIHRSAWLGNVLEMDDVHRTAILHPGPVIWPMMESPTRSMNAMLDAAVRGYEAIIAIGSTFDQRHYGFYHNTATAGIFGAAVAAITAQRSDLDMLVNAMGLAGSVAGGLWQMRHEACDAKQWHVAHALRSGREAALAAEAGAVGPRYVLEGEQGLYAATCDKAKPMLLADGWQMHAVSFKPWGACRHVHPAIDAALQFQQQYGALSGEILVETYADALTFCDRADPQSVVEAKFSLQHGVAVAASKGAPELADFEVAAFDQFANLRSQVVVRECPDITARYPAHFGARISANGHQLELVDTLGDPERPIDRAQIIDKMHALALWGGLTKKDADRATSLALEGDEPDAIAHMLGEWLL
ncbi:MmgE/PrpD family protein [Alterisphingorhabdus coralli]|uniref:MmgE/PrpD family protein n=1 Tax=Alterisphingorhabdus coralli TaxID=3071408 RepID=A0AA97F8D0_9SPHN|nr:MmgE/PrpD family protein [Parasphingorhabdus sp. SCSIO 66989]WOE75381.1 MmgE/PrpD family protein [Parasphingorhabdus sp. SCSIO 66989]